MTAPDTGGYYFDGQRTGFVGVVRRNVRQGMDALTSGDAGGRAVAVAFGFVLFGLARRAWNEVN